MKIYDFKTYEEMSQKAAEMLRGQLSEKPDSVLGFATGSSPEGMYKALIQLNKENKIDFSKVRATFNLDEYFPIKKTDPQSYYRFMMDKLFSHINLDPAVINVPNGEAGDPHEECADYEKKIALSGGIDFQLLGIGDNGHIGFNEPSDHFPALSHYASLAPATVEANARFFSSADDVPKNSITMGIQSIMMAKKILVICGTQKRAELLREAIYGKITPHLPASVLRLHQNVTIMTSNGAGKYLISNP